MIVFDCFFGKIFLGHARQDKQGKARQENARQDKTGQGKIRHDRTRQDRTTPPHPIRFTKGGHFKAGVRGEVNLPPGGSEVRKKGRKEERKKERKEEGRKRGLEERGGALHARPSGSADLRGLGFYEFMKNGCPNGPPKSSRSSHWAPIVEFFEICEVLKVCVF